MKKKDEIRGKVMRARAGLVLDHPFFGHLALRLKLVEDRDCDTAWSDGKVLAYNPLYADLLSGEKLKGLMGHVTMHPACRHHLRRNGRHKNLWNMACDYAINWILLDAGLTLPDGYLDDPDLRGKNADEIYARLAEDPDNARPESMDGPSEHKETENGEKDEDVDAEGRRGKQSDPSESGSDEDLDAEPDAAQEADPENDGKRSEHGDPGRAGEVRDAPPPEAGAVESGDEIEEESRWRINLAQALSRARRMGDLPAGLERLVENLLAPKLDWRSLLNRFIQASIRCDYAWTPPNRRYIHRGLYLPAMRSDDLPEVVVALDTSGSVSPGELDQFAAELSAILETCAMTVHLLYCDMRVVRAERFKRQDLPLVLKPAGGGGTDFRPAFDWVDRQGIAPMCMIYLTDMACNRFPSEPPYPVLWAFIGNEDIRPPFGDALAVT